jgi:hypothetical protein
MVELLDFEASKERCKNILCGLCGRRLRPIHNDQEKRYAHLTCIEKWNREVYIIETQRAWDNYMNEQLRNFSQN